MAGGSAQREYQRRAQRREQAVRAAHPRLGGLLLALAGEPQHQRAWAVGGAGERAIGGRLDELAADGVLVLHDRRMRDAQGRLTRANIDHVAISAAGVWVIDAKAYAGSLEVRRSGGLFSPRVEQLWIGGRNKTALVDGVLAQAAAVRRELAAVSADVAVRPVLAFVGTDMPWVGASSVNGVDLASARRLAKLVRQPGDLDEQARQDLAAFVAMRFPAA